MAISSSESVVVETDCQMDVTMAQNGHSALGGFMRQLLQEARPRTTFDTSKSRLPQTATDNSSEGEEVVVVINDNA